MASLGSVMVIKRDGKDGGCLRLRKKKCIIGRNLDCDIRIQLPNVDAQHAELFLDDDSQVCDDYERLFTAPILCADVSRFLHHEPKVD